MDELTMRVYTYFFTRNVLTQKKLRSLTGLSLGKISLIVKFLIDMSVLERLNKKKKGSIIPADIMRQQIYSMNSVQKSFFKSALNSGKIFLQNKPRFEEIMSELVVNEAELKHLNGYENVLEVLKNYLRLFSTIKKIEQIYKNFL